MQDIVCTLRVPLHAVQLTLHFRELIRPFRYYARFAHYKPVVRTKTNKNEPLIRFVFFISWFATGLVTMQGIVVSIRQWE